MNILRPSLKFPLPRKQIKKPLDRGLSMRISGACLCLLSSKGSQQTCSQESSGISSQANALTLSPRAPPPLLPESLHAAQLAQVSCLCESPSKGPRQPHLGLTLPHVSKGQGSSASAHSPHLPSALPLAHCPSFNKHPLKLTWTLVGKSFLHEVKNAHTAGWPAADLP